MEKINFHIGEKKHLKSFSKSQLHLGKILYVQFLENEDEVNVSENEIKGSIRFAVNYIKKDYTDVTLVSESKIGIEVIDPLYDQLKDYIDKETLYNKVNSINKEVRLEHIHKTKENYNSKIHLILLVSNRLRFIETLNHKDIQLQLFLHWHPLVNYLLFTCFDSLGNNVPFLNFDDWVTKNKNAIDETKMNSNSELILSLYKKYKSGFGTKNSFYRFIEEILPDQTRNELLQSVKQSKSLHAHLGSETTEINSPEFVKKFLYEYRNNYTHKSKTISGPLPPSLINFQDCWCVISQEENDKYILQTSIRNWPAIIEKCVKVGLAEYIKKN